MNTKDSLVRTSCLDKVPPLNRSDMSIPALSTAALYKGPGRGCTVTDCPFTDRERMRDGERGVQVKGEI